MTPDDPSSRDAPPAAVVDRFTPDAATRLSVPTDPPPAPVTARARSRRGFAAARGLLSPRSAETPPASTSHGTPQPPRRRRKLTPIKRLERYFSAIFKLGRTEGMAKDARKRITASELRMDAIEGELGKLGHDIRQIWERTDQIGQVMDTHQDSFSAIEQAMNDQNTALHDHIDATSDRIDSVTHTLSDRLDQHHDQINDQLRDIALQTAATLRATQAETALLARLFSDLTRRVDQMAQATGTQAPDLVTDPARRAAAVTLPASDGFDLFKDSFYHRLENRYRGSVEDITKRLSIYLPDMESASIRTGRKPAMDIGCGRGEWLGLLRDNGIEAFGIDTNPVQIEAAREAGALGARLSGGGFGGSAIVMVPAAEAQAIGDAIKSICQSSDIHPDIVEVSPSAGAHIVDTHKVAPAQDAIPAI